MIHRANRSEGYTLILNEIIRNPAITSEAFRLLAFMLSCSDDFNFSIKGLAYCLEWSERKTKQYIQELKKLGYIVQTKQRGEHGHYVSDSWDVYEIPTSEHNFAPSSRVQKSVHTTTVQFNDRSFSRAPRKIAPIRINNNKELTNTLKNNQTYIYTALGIFENVLLTDDEQKDLLERYGMEKLGDYISRLSNYLHAHPEKNYKSHKTVIEKWIKQDERRLAN